MHKLLTAVVALAAHTGPTALAQELRRVDLGALRPAGSSWLRDGTQVSCTGRQILYH